MTTMQCLTCGDTRGTMQNIKWPERRLKCAACGCVTRHRVIADPNQGDWREDLNLEPKGSRTPPQAAPLRAIGTAAMPDEAIRLLDNAGLRPVEVDNLGRDAWVLGTIGFVLIDREAAEVRPFEVVNEILRMMANREAPKRKGAE